MTSDGHPGGRRRSVFPGFADIEPATHPVVAALTDRRRTQGRSQADLARTMGTSQPAVARMERGGADVRLSTVDRWAAALGCEVVWTLRPLPGEPGTSPDEGA